MKDIPLLAKIQGLKYEKHLLHLIWQYFPGSTAQRSTLSNQTYTIDRKLHTLPNSYRIY